MKFYFDVNGFEALKDEGLKELLTQKQVLSSEDNPKEEDETEKQKLSHAS